jgi:hypothetical protein
MTKRKKDKRKNNNLQNAIQETKYFATWAQLNTRDELRYSGRVKQFLLHMVSLLPMSFANI